MGKKGKKPGKGKEKTERKTAKADGKRARRETKKVSQEDDIDAILVIHPSGLIITFFRNKNKNFPQFLRIENFNCCSSLDGICCCCCCCCSNECSVVSG